MTTDRQKLWLWQRQQLQQRLQQQQQRQQQHPLLLPYLWLLLHRRRVAINSTGLSRPPLRLHHHQRLLTGKVKDGHTLAIVERSLGHHRTVRLVPNLYCAFYLEIPVPLMVSCSIHASSSDDDKCSSRNNEDDEAGGDNNKTDDEINKTSPSFGPIEFAFEVPASGRFAKVTYFLHFLCHPVCKYGIYTPPYCSSLSPSCLRWGSATATTTTTTTTAAAARLS